MNNIDINKIFTGDWTRGFVEKFNLLGCFIHTRQNTGCLLAPHPYYRSATPLRSGTPRPPIPTPNPKLKEGLKLTGLAGNNGKQRLLRTAFALILTFFTILPAFASKKSATNLALNKPTKASSAEEPSDAITDGNYASFWQSGSSLADHWIEVDLGPNYNIDRVNLPLVQGSDSLLLQIWQNNNWNTVGHFQQNNPQIYFEPASTHKIRLKSIGGGILKIYEVQVFEHDPQPVFVNQAGYDLHRPKFFTAPLSPDGTRFTISKEGATAAIFEGSVENNQGKFTDFKPQDDPGPYEIHLQNESGSISAPFWIAPGLVEKVSYQPAINFMVDVRCWFGDASNYNPTDESADCPNLGVAWRDSHQFSREIPGLLNLYFANPAAWETGKMPVQGLYLGLEEELPDDTPEIIRLIYWAVDIYLKGEVNHTLLKEQLAYFLYAYPLLADYIPRNVYEKARDYLFPIWGDEAINRWQWHDIEHTGNLFQVYDFIGTGKGQFPPGHSIVPNLMMYEVARREDRTDAKKFFQAAYDQAEWLIENLDWTDPRTTKGQRQGEPVTIPALVYFQQNYPKQAPKGIEDKVFQWARVAIERGDNMWHFRRYSDQRWIIPSIRPENDDRYDSETGFNEVGNIAGFPAPALSAAALIDDPEVKNQLEILAVAQLDHVFGRNPAGRHFSFDATTDFEGVELGWFKEYQGGAGILQTARGVLDGSPKETIFPYHPEAGDPGHTEGWVTFNSAWNIGLAYFSASGVEVAVMDPEFTVAIKSVRKGEEIGISLQAPLNFRLDHQEEAYALVYLDEKPQKVPLKEVTASSTWFRGTFTIPENSNAKRMKVAYGYGWHEKAVEIKVR